MVFRLYFCTSYERFTWTSSINYNVKSILPEGCRQKNIIPTYTYLLTIFNVQCSIFTNHQQSLGKMSKVFTFILISSMHLISKTTFSLRCRCVVVGASFHFLVDHIENSFIARDFKSDVMTVPRSYDENPKYFFFLSFRNV